MTLARRSWILLHHRGPPQRWWSSQRAPHPADIDVTLHEPDPRSKRQRLRDQPLDHKLLHHLHEMGVGWSRGDRPRVGRQRRREHERIQAKAVRAATPAPFNGPPGKRYATANTWDALPANLGKTCEVAFVGRSNVGKSTLLNVLLGLTNRPKDRSPVSATPGMTQALHFYSIGRRQPLSLVDMPGYGFAYAAEDEVEQWSELMVQYLRHRGPVLKRVCLLLDARHGLKYVDQQFLELLYSKQSVVPLPPNPTAAATDAAEAAKKHASNGGKNRRNDVLPPRLQVVFTKCDLVERVELARKIQFVRAQLDDILPPRAGRLPSMMVSSLKGPGVLQLQRELAALRPLAHKQEPIDARDYTNTDVR